ncbi:MAG: hypothetical protein ACP5RF_01885 [Candidatus Micrarchaeia archaeon]
MMDLFMLAFNTCAIGGGGVNTNNWIGINMLVVLVFFAIAGILYALSNLMPASAREKIKTIAKFEGMQVITSLFIIFVIAAFAATSCSISNSISGMDTFAAAQYYLANLLFVNGLNLVTHIYTVSIEFTIAGIIARFVGGFVMSLLSHTMSISIFNFSIGLSSGVETVYDSYAGAVVSYNIFVIVSFGMLFLQFLMLFIVKAIALTIVLPLAIIMRSLSFVGPKLRETADAFLALAIAFYFIYPLTFVMNSYVMNWLYCSGGASTCNPYLYEYPFAYSTQQLSESTLFNSNPSYTVFGFPIQIPADFYGTMLSNGLSFQDILLAPASIGAIAQEVSEYLFQGVFLVALDLALTVGFALGLSKALTRGLGIRTSNIWG